MINQENIALICDVMRFFITIFRPKRNHIFGLTELNDLLTKDKCENNEETEKSLYEILYKSN